MDFFICCAYLSIILMRPQDFLPWLYALHPLDIMAVAGILTVGYRLLQSEKPVMFESPVLICLLGLWFAAVWTFVMQTFAFQVRATFEIVGKLMLGPALIVSTVTTRKRLDTLLLCILLFIVVIGLHCAKQYHTGAGFGGLAPMYEPQADGSTMLRVRAYGIYSGPNEVGTIAAVGIILGMYLVRRHKTNPVIVPLAIGALYLFGNVLFWTGSRAAILMGMAGLAAMLFSKYKRLFQIMLVTAPPLLILFMKIVGGRFASMGGEGSAYKRVRAITECLRLFKRNPLFGVGRDRAYDAIGLHMPPHNSFVQLAAETGLFGFSFYVGCFLCAFLPVYFMERAKPDTDEEKVDVLQANVLFAICTIFVITSFFQNRSYHVDGYCFLAIAGAFGLNCVRHYGKDVLPSFFSSSRFFTEGKGAALLALCALAMVVVMFATSRLYWIFFK